MRTPEQKVRAAHFSDITPETLHALVVHALNEKDTAVRCGRADVVLHILHQQAAHRQDVKAMKGE